MKPTTTSNTYWNWDSSKCVFCKRCLISCPNYSLRLKADGSIQNNVDSCNFCGACIKVCTPNAITISATCQ